MIQSTVKTYQNPSLTNLSQKWKTLTHLKQLHAHLIKSHLSENPTAIGPLLSVAATSNNPSFFSYALSIFRNLQCRNTFMYNTMIRGYVQGNLSIPAILCYVDLLNYGLVANNYTFPPLIKACSNLGGCSSNLIGCLVHAHVVKLGHTCDLYVVSALVEFYGFSLDMRSARKVFDEIPVKDVVLWTAMIDGYGKNEDVENARALFEEMPERNVISWSAIIAAYSRVNDFKAVISLFTEMQEQGIRPNESILVSVLTACAHLGALAQGLWVHSYAKRLNFDSNPILATALVDMYSKCGSTKLALSVFEGIRFKDVGACNAIISGVAMYGDARKSLELFSDMVRNKVQPTETTFVAVLSACTHARLVREGLELFDQMSRVYGVEPRVEHYACVVDLFARSGMLREAEEFVEKNLGEIAEGDANVWGALLGACRIHRNVEIGNRIWKKLVGMRVADYDYGTHVLSYNMYKEAGWESEAKCVRKLISESGRKKTPGCSMIEVDGELEEFVAGNFFHPRMQEICIILDSLFSVALYFDDY